MTRADSLHDQIAAMREGHFPTAACECTFRDKCTEAKLLDAVEAVMAEHARKGATSICQGCIQHWPCPTVTALTLALGGE